MAGVPPPLYRYPSNPTMNAKVSTPRLVLAVFALVVAWAPAATLARPGAQHPAFATRAEAQSGRAVKDAATKHDTVARPAS
jgi:hypothetical protein